MKDQAVVAVVEKIGVPTPNCGFEGRKCGTEKWKKKLNGERVQSRKERPKKVEKYTRFKRGKATEIKRTCYPIGLAS